MSENKNLSIDEIIKRAEEIKAEAERQLVSAEKSLNEKAKAAQEEIILNESEAQKRIAEAFAEAEKEDDVKEYNPSKSNESAEEDVKVFSPSKSEKAEPEAESAEEAPVINDGKTRNVVLDKSSDTIVVPDKLGEEKRAEERTKPVTFITKTKDGESDDDGLEDIPTIVSKEKLYNTFNAEAENAGEIDEGVQITFEGFDEKVDTVEKIDEVDAERELAIRRKEKVGKFRLFGPDETDSTLGSDVVVDDDYESESEKESFIDSLISEKQKVRIRVLLGGIIGLIIIALTALKDTTLIPLSLSSHTAYFTTALVLYCAVLIVNGNVLFHGFNIRRKVNFDLPVSIVAVGILIHTFALTISSSLWIDNGVLLAGAGAFALCMSQIGKLKMMSRIVDNFDFITSPGDKYTLENITNSVDAEIISRGAINDEPKLKMSVKTDFPTNFLEISCKNEPADKTAVRIFIVDFVLSLALFIAIGVMDNFNTALNVALCGLAISLPCSALLLTNSQLCDISAQLKDYDSRVCGFEGALMASNGNAVVMEAADLFGKDSCGLHGIKTFGGAKVDDAIINAAAVIVKTKSPLAHVFDDVIIGQQSILPRVDDVTYEEKLGTSAWIYDKKVLVGTRELLIHHDVSVPKESYEEKFTQRDRKALYLAIDGKIIAMFIVSYVADKMLSSELRKLEKNDVAVIVKSADPYITEESIAELFELRAGFVRVMNYSAARAFDKYSNLEVEKSPAYVVHSGTALGLIGAMRGAGIIVGTKGIISFLCAFGCLFGFAAVAFFSLISAYSQISALGIIVFQAIWTAFIYVIIKLKGLGL